MKAIGPAILLAAGLFRAGSGIAAQSSGAAVGPTVVSAGTASVDVGNGLNETDADSAANRGIALGVTAHVGENQAVLFDVGYDITTNLSVQMMVGVPPKAGEAGAGSVAALGELGKLRYAPVTMAGYHRFRGWGAFQADVGMGAAYALLLKEPNAAVSALEVDKSWGFVLQARTHYDLGRRCELFFDIKQIWLAVNARGSLASGVATMTTVRLDPTLISAGIDFHFD